MAGKLAEKRNVVRADGSAHKLHLRFVRCLAAFYIIAAQARAYQILPGVLATSAFRHDMIDRESDAGCAAILAAVAVSAQNIFSRQNNFLERYANIAR